MAHKCLKNKSDILISASTASRNSRGYSSFALNKEFAVPFRDTKHRSI